MGSTVYQFMGNRTVLLTSSLMIYIHRSDHFHGKVSSECPSRFDAAAATLYWSYCTSYMAAQK